jgi:hypothetical protein
MNGVRLPGDLPGFKEERPVKKDDLPKAIKVSAYSGYKANERPLAFTLDGRQHDVAHIIDRWYGVEHDYFKVLAEDGKVYLLRWHRILDLWFLVKVIERAGQH